VASLISRPNRVKHWKPGDTKKCTRCGETKPITEFSSHSQKPHLFQSHCKRCGNRISLSAWRARSPASQYASQLKRRLKRYGLTPATYEEMLIAQGRRCAICGTDDPCGRANHAGKTRFTVDHDHKTGKVRGLLCMECNRGLGAFDDDAERMALATAYLIGHAETKA
jgi:hypothetical protein